MRVVSGETPVAADAVDIEFAGDGIGIEADYLYPLVEARKDEFPLHPRARRASGSAHFFTLGLSVRPVATDKNSRD